MGTLLFILRALLQPLNWPYDFPFACLLLALELPGYWRVWLLWRRR